MKVQVLSDLESLSREAAAMFLRFSEEFIEKEGRFAVAVSGGSTPVMLYRLLGSEPYAERIMWDKVHFFWVDERLVPRDQPDSNFRLLQDSLLRKISIPAENVHPVRTDLSSPAVSAMTYEEEIKKFFRLSRDRLPEFDLILLGIGEDGHIASLFPSSDVLTEKKLLAASVGDQKHKHPRVTLTLPVINNAQNIVFLVSGRNKAPVIKRVLDGRDVSLPASLVKQDKENLFFLLDEDASLLLDRKC